MKRTLPVLMALGATVFAAGQGLAHDLSGEPHDLSSEPPKVKRQAIKNCMLRKMSADRTMSYNSASKVCTALTTNRPVNETASNIPLKQ